MRRGKFNSDRQRRGGNLGRIRHWAMPALFAFILVLGSPPAAEAHIVIQGSPEFVEAVEECLEKIADSGGTPADNLTQLTNSENIHTIRESDGSNYCSPSDAEDATDGTGTGSTTNWDPDLEGDLGGGIERDPCASMAHELDHATHNDSGDNDFTSTGHNGIPTAEIEACETENEYREANGLPERTHYGGNELPDSGDDTPDDGETPDGETPDGEETPSDGATQEGDRA